MVTAAVPPGLLDLALPRYGEALTLEELGEGHGYT